MRYPAQIAAEFEADGQAYAVFVDNNLGSNRAYLRELCEALRPLNKIWSAAVSIDVTDDPALIRTMALAGCTGVFVGFESLTEENLADARKKTPKAGDYARRVRMLHDNGIQVNGSNRCWRLLIKYHLVHATWRPLVELTRRRHVRFRQELAGRESLNRRGPSVVAAGV